MASHPEVQGILAVAPCDPHEPSGELALGGSSVAMLGSVSEVWVHLGPGGSRAFRPPRQLLQKAWKALYPSWGKSHPVFPKLWMELTLYPQLWETPPCPCSGGGTACSGQGHRRSSSQTQDIGIMHKMLYEGKILHYFNLVLITPL